MRIETHREGSSLTIALEGKLDVNSAPELKAVLADELPGVEHLILDFGGLIYISSAGLRVLISAMQTMDEQGTLSVMHMRDFVREILDETGILQELDVLE